MNTIGSAGKIDASLNKTRYVQKFFHIMRHITLGRIFAIQQKPKKENGVSSF
jgi:hypothetical protein